MAKSATPLPKKISQDILSRFFQVTGDLRTGSEARLFLTDFLTESERMTFAKRLAIAVELEDGKSYEEIRKIYGVSSATISSVAEMMSKDGVQLALKKVKTEQWADAWADKILKYFP